MTRHNKLGVPTPADTVDAADADAIRCHRVSVNSVNGGNEGHGDADLVHAYSRAQAIADGVLVDVTRQASPAEMRGGFAIPVDVTAAVWAAIEAIPDSLVGIADPRGRLHDVLWMASVAARRQPGASFASFALRMPRRGTRQVLVRLAIAVGPGDHGEPVATIGFLEDM